LNSRQRVKCAIAFNDPDRAPISHAVLPAAQLKCGQSLDEILTTFREDFGWHYMQNMVLEDFPAVYKKETQTTLARYGFQNDSGFAVFPSSGPSAS
jgi:hypothetical protein